MTLTFRQAFQRFLDTNLWTIMELSIVFRVTQQQIKAWADGTELPAPDNMRGLHEMMKEDLRYPTAEFSEMMEAPIGVSLADSKTVLPPELERGANLRHYSLHPMRQGFMRRLSCLSCDEQERLIGVFSKMMNESLLERSRKPKDTM